MAVMKNGLHEFLFLFLFLSGSITCALGEMMKIHYEYIKRHLTWSDAQTYCKCYHTDLAGFAMQSDLTNLQMTQYNAWIGLYKLESGEQNWNWTSPNAFTLTEWADNEPSSDDHCAYVSYDSQKVYGSACQKHHFFFCFQPKKQNPQHAFIPISKTWAEAQEHCKMIYKQDLLTLMSNWYLKYISVEQFPVWIGPYDEQEFANWVETSTTGGCTAVLSKTKHIVERNCYDRFPFVCMDDNMRLVTEEKTWEEALEHCRAITSANGSLSGYDLLSVQPGELFNYVMTKAKQADTNEVWIGLRFLAGSWFWANGGDMSYYDLPQCPNAWQHCGVLSKNNMDSVETRDCGEKKNFLCFKN